MELEHEDLRAKIRSLLEKLASPHCEVRQQAVLDEWSKLSIAHVSAAIAILEEQLRSAGEYPRSRGTVILESLRKETISNGGRAFETLLGRWLAPALQASDNKKAAQFRAAKRELLGIAKKRSNPFAHRAAAVGVMAYLVDHYGDPHGAAERKGLPIREWKSELILLLADRDLELRTMAAIAIGSLSGFADVPRSHVIPILVSGLRSEDFDVRLRAQRELRRLTGEQFCIDPTDALSERESGIQRWEAWWTKRKG